MKNWMLDEMPDAIADLATALSVALRVEPELVRAVRLEILPTADVGTEADLWFGPWVGVREADAVVFDDSVRQELQDRLAGKLRSAAPGSRWHLVGDVVERVHVNTSPALRLEERIAWLAVSAGDDAAEKIEQELRAPLRAILEEGRTPLAEWFRSAWYRLPDAARRTRVAWMLAQVTAARAGGADLPVAELPDGMRIADLAEIAPVLPDVRVGVLRRDDHLEIGQVAGPGSVAILVPGTIPRILELLEPAGTPTGGKAAGSANTVAIPPSGVVRLPIAHAEPIRLRTARGHVYDIAPGRSGPNILVAHMAADEAWAHWIAWQLTAGGWSVRVVTLSDTSDRDVPWPDLAPGGMDTILLVLSPTFVRSPGAAAIATTPRVAGQRVIAVRVAPLQGPGLLASVDLFGATEHDSRRALMNAVGRKRRPSLEPAGRPGSGSNPDGGAPAFPGLDDTFVSRVMVVTQLRHPEAVVTVVPALDDTPAHLLIATMRDDNSVEQRPVGVAEHGVDTAVLAAFAGQVHRRYEAENPWLESELVYAGPTVHEVLVAEARRIGIRLVNFTVYQNVLDLSGYLGRQAARLESDPIYPPALYVPQRMTRLDLSAQPVADDTLGQIVSWLSSDEARFVLVLGDFGRGKTFLLHELARRLPAELPDVLPVLVELRVLEKSPDLDAMVAAHLVRAGEERFDLASFRYMLREGRIALLFDGFDELALRVTYARATEHLSTFVSALQGKAKIVVSSRSQHFLADDDVLRPLTSRSNLAPNLRLVRLEDFTDTQIRDFLVRRYAGQLSTGQLPARVSEPHGGSETRETARAIEAGELADQRMELIRDVGDLFGLARNPRMLSFIADLDEQRLRAAQARSRSISSTDLYRELVDAWFEYEENRAYQAGSAPLLTKAERLGAATLLAVRLWGSAERSIGLDELTATAGSVLSTMVNTRGLGEAQAAQVIGSGTLLGRDAEGRFSFIHASVMEYLAVTEAARLLSDRGQSEAAQEMLGAREASDLMIDFLCGTAEHGDLQTWAVAVLRNRRATSSARSNALRVARRLGIQTGETPPMAERTSRSRDHDVFRVYISFSAENNREGEVSRFVRDLSRIFRALSGFAAADYSFYLSHDLDRQGASWLDELNRELNRADILMPVMSPDFFRSAWCAQEWGAFEERLALLPDIEMHERIIPVVWFPEEPPPAGRGLRIGWGPSQVLDYREVGLSLLREEDPRQYATAVRLLAVQLKKLVEDGDRIPAIDPPIDFPRAAQAFPPRLSNTPCASWNYYLVHASVSRAGLATLESVAAADDHSPPGLEPRNPRHYYGENSEQWDPFRQDDDQRLESQVRRAIEDETWSHRMRPAEIFGKILDFTYGIPSEVTELRDGRRTLVIVSMDAWLIQYGVWRSHVQTLANLTEARMVLLAPKPPDEQFAQAFPRLQGELAEVFTRPAGETPILLRFPDSPESLVHDLRELLPEAVSVPFRGRSYRHPAVEHPSSSP